MILSNLGRQSEVKLSSGRVRWRNVCGRMRVERCSCEKGSNRDTSPSCSFFSTVLLFSWSEECDGFLEGLRRLGAVLLHVGWGEVALDSPCERKMSSRRNSTSSRYFTNLGGL